MSKFSSRVACNRSQSVANLSSWPSLSSGASGALAATLRANARQDDAVACDARRRESFSSPSADISTVLTLARSPESRDRRPASTNASLAPPRRCVSSSERDRRAPRLVRRFAWKRFLRATPARRHPGDASRPELRTVRVFVQFTATLKLFKASRATLARSLCMTAALFLSLTRLCTMRAALAQRAPQRPTTATAAMAQDAARWRR